MLRRQACAKLAAPGPFSGVCAARAPLHGTAALLHRMLHFAAQAQGKAQLGQHEQRPDDQAHDVIQESRLAALVVCLLYTSPSPRD